jgi:hypothetical protein
MSSDTAPSISRSSDPAITIACAGFCSAALQSVYFRELLSVFRGNEISIGLIFSVWLLATGSATLLAGSRFPGPRGPNTERRGQPILIALLCLFAVWGFFSIRSARLVSGSGVTVGPLEMVCIVVVAIVPFTIVNGLLLGVLFSRSGDRQKSWGALYGMENAGAVAGALCVFCCIVLNSKNSVIAALSLLPFLIIVGKRPLPAVIAFCCMVTLIVFDTASSRWKYPGVPVSRIAYGLEAEIASVATGTDTTLFVNGSVYRSTMGKPVCEQAVHIPLSQRPRASRALVVFDHGWGAQLSKYPGLVVDIIETEPALAPPGSNARIGAVELLRPAWRYDVVFLGVGMPHTAASNRFYTRSFFLKIKSLLSDSGMVSFTLPFSENYLDHSEQKLYNSLLSTLGAVWKNVAVFPGDGYTFMASNGACEPLPSRMRIKTEYLSSSIIPGVSGERIQSANKKPEHAVINTRDRPVTLLLGLQTWLDQFKFSVWFLFALLGAVCVAVIVSLPKTRNTLSVATSGCSAGIYSVCLLLLYQTTFGSLYSRVSLLLVCLTAGFAIGSFAKKFPLSDFFIGVYAVVSLCSLALVPFPPTFLFYLFHTGIGVLTGAQFVTRGAPGTTSLASLYAADLLGGAIGMAVCSTLLVPLFGAISVAAGIFIMKAIVETINYRL